MSIALNDKTFELIANNDGHAASKTVMRFGSATHPFRATYAGPNVVYGEAIVQGNQMVYHALAADGSLNAGRATVSFDGDEETIMRLDWEWLSAEGNGISLWRLIDSAEYA